MRSRYFKKLLGIFVAVLMVLSMIPHVTFGAEVPSAEWYNYRNNQENNGITSAKTPIDSDTTTLKYAESYGGGGYTNSPTPPLIIGDKLYFGSNDVVVEADKNTGKELRRSKPLIKKVGYAMNSLLYIEGKLFVQVEDGSVQAVDLATLEPIWHTAPISSQQTLSPISSTTVDGKTYIYTGTWMAEDQDGEFFAVAVDEEGLTGNAEDLGGKTKAYAWIFQPSGADKNTIKDLKYDEELYNNIESEEANAHRGFYWAGAYSSSKYIIVGTDNGSSDESQETAILYSLNPKTGEVISKIDGIRGDIRSSVAYNNGSVYFTTKGGLLCKANVSANGELTNLSSAQIGASSTATPIVYKGRIYASLKGEGSPYTSNGGHGFAILKDENKISESSLIYNVDTPGYCQGAALLTTAYENEDFDKDGDPDGRVYIYCTLNTKPGSVFYFYDEPDATAPIGTAKYIYTPEESFQQHCISPVVADSKGRIYFKNDSSRIFAIETEKDEAYLDNLEVMTNESKNAAISPSFSNEKFDYTTEVEATTTGVKLNLTYNEDKIEDVQVAVAGAPKVKYDREAVYNLDGESTTITVSLASKTDKKEYNLTIKKMPKKLEYRKTDAQAGANEVSVSSLMEDTVTLSVTPILEANVPEKIKESIATRSEDVERFLLGAEIKLINGKVKGPFNVEFNLGADKDGRKVLVHHLNGTTVESFEKTVMGGKVAVTTDSLSPFTISLLKDPNTEPTPGEDTDLNNKKMEAKKNLGSYKEKDAYRDEEAKKLDEILEKAAMDIDAAKDQMAIDNIVADAKAKIDALKTKEEYKAEEKAEADKLNKEVQAIFNSIEKSFLTDDYKTGKCVETRNYTVAEMNINSSLDQFKAELAKEDLDLVKLKELRDTIEVQAKKLEETSAILKKKVDDQRNNNNDIQDDQNNQDNQDSQNNSSDSNVQNTNQNMNNNSTSSNDSMNNSMNKPVKVKKNRVKTGDSSLDILGVSAVMIASLVGALYLRRKRG